MELSEQIRVAREAAGITQEQLADKLKVSKTAVVWWETGVHAPRLQKLRQIEEVLHTSFNATGRATDPADTSGVAADDISLAIAIRRLPKAQRDAILTLVQLGVGQAVPIESFTELESEDHVDGKKLARRSGPQH